MVVGGRYSRRLQWVRKEAESDGQEQFVMLDFGTGDIPADHLRRSAKSVTKGSEKLTHLDVVSRHLGCSTRHPLVQPSQSAQAVIHAADFRGKE